MQGLARRLGAAGAAVVAVLSAGCDPQRISELQPGVSTEADVRARFGQPEAIWEGPGGGHVLEYNRNPAGQVNYMIAIGPDGKLVAVNQVLTPENFARVQPGMPMEQVRRMLGKPAKQLPLPLKRESAWDWRYVQPPNTAMVFTVWFNEDWRVARTATGPDPEAPENRGGGGGR